MIKNIIFDIGGVLFDDSTQNISNLFHEDATEFCKKVYGKAFRDCVLGKVGVIDYIESFRDDRDYDKIQSVLRKENLSVSYPLMQKNYDYISSLKKRGYHLYILSNITEESYEYVKSSIPLEEIFEGGVYSYQENVLKPDKRIYEIIVNRYHLNPEETLFFDDRQRNVDAACEIGIKGVLFHTIEDIENHLNENKE